MGEMNVPLRPFAVLNEDLSLFLETTSSGSHLPIAPAAYDHVGGVSFQPGPVADCPN